MPYSEFTLESAKKRLGLESRTVDLFPKLQAISPSPWLLDLLELGSQNLNLSLISEKSRSEFIVAPILLECRKLSQNQVVIHSGQRLDIAPEQGLNGECDFILAATGSDMLLSTPIATIVEAKRNDIEQGLGQCVAQMVAAQRFNQALSKQNRPVYGCVTTGEDWQFLRLDNNLVLVNLHRFYINVIDKILGALQTIIHDCLRTPDLPSS